MSFILCEFYLSKGVIKKMLKILLFRVQTGLKLRIKRFGKLLSSLFPFSSAPHSLALLLTSEAHREQKDEKSKEESENMKVFWRILPCFKKK